MVKYNGKKIVYTFRYGSIMSTNDKIGFSVMTAFWLVVMILSVSLGYICDNPLYGWIYFVLAGFLFVIFLAITLKFWLKDICAEKEIAVWLTDEHLFEAHAVPEKTDPIPTRTGYAYKHIINFENNGNGYQRITANHGDLGAVKFKDGDEITFLYSPKYGEVMVFENEQVK